MVHDESLHVLAEKYHVLETYSSTKNRKNDTLLLQISIKTFGICDIGVSLANSDIVGSCLETQARPSCRSLLILNKFKEVFSIQVEPQQSSFARLLCASLFQTDIHLLSLVGRHLSLPTTTRNRLFIR